MAIKVKQQEVEKQTAVKEISRLKDEALEAVEKHRRLADAYKQLQENCDVIVAECRQKDTTWTEQARQRQTEQEAAQTEIRSLAKRLKEKDRKIAQMET